jgi:hypothetical protein
MVEAHLVEPQRGPGGAEFTSDASPILRGVKAGQSPKRTDKIRRHCGVEAPFIEVTSRCPHTAGNIGTPVGCSGRAALRRNT